MIQPHDGAAAAGAPNQNVFINSDVAGAEGEWLRIFYHCRIVGVFNHESKLYHLYVTNIPTSVLNAEQSARLYRSRWLIEFLFRQLKTNLRLDEIPTRKKHIAEALVYVTLISLLISRSFLAELKQFNHTQPKFPGERWAAIWSTIAPDLLAILLRPNVNRLLATH